MEEKISVEIPIPTDDDGYILLRCAHCGTYFKVTPDDFNNEEILHIFCPSCGLISENYLTDDVRDLALSMIQNKAVDMIYEELKKAEKKSQHNFIKIKIGAKPKHDPEFSIRSVIDTLEITRFPCCNRNAKIKPILRLSGCYCPFCGVRDYDIE